jgi:ubiquinone/menaquinone biosynthesis C-methylase UbiE
MRQLEHAYQADNIFYSVANESTSFPENYFDLITVAQAAHWFDMPVFCDEAKRVSKDNGLIALWGYSLFKVNPAVDELVTHFYTHVIGPYWDKERRHIDEHFRTIYFPFEVIESPLFKITVNWTLAELEGYINTWSAVQKYISANQQNPVEELIKQLAPHWKESVQNINFPLFLKLGRIYK